MWADKDLSALLASWAPPPDEGPNGRLALVSGVKSAPCTQVHRGTARRPTGHVRDCRWAFPRVLGGLMPETMPVPLGPSQSQGSDHALCR